MYFTPASKRTDDENISGIFSQKLAAHLAGLGWIEKELLTHHPGSRTPRPLGQHPDRCPAPSDGKSYRTAVR